ncbi:immunity protein Tsi6 family protein, partial [Pseudomonas sp. IPO3779]|uniref:immunity protein Tsi6 family protein n=2 Tax=Pseudomonas TaxID=286 RepID=UPI0015A31AC4
VQKAIELTANRRNACPQFPVYDLLLKQLDYVKAVFDGSETDKSRLHQLSIGAIASKEFEENDPELARALKDAYYVAIQSARGLKIQLPD